MVNTLAMKRLLVLIDYSPYSEQIIKWAYEWFNHFEYEIIFIHHYNSIIPALTDHLTMEQIRMEDEITEMLRLRSFVQNFFPFTSKVYFRVSDISLVQILEEMKDDDTDDLILAGLKGTNLLKSVFIGSTIIKLIDKNIAPIVAIPLGGKIKIPTKLIFATHYKYPLHMLMLDKFIQTYMNGKLEELQFMLVHTSGEDEDKAIDYLGELINRFDNMVKTTSFMYKGDDVLDNIKHYMLLQEDSFLAVQKGSRDIMDRLFRKFIVSDLVNDGSIPLIVFPS